jgi:hypothetical protein
MKPFGDRLLYRKKRLWDQDAALMTHVLDLPEGAEGGTIGFERSKLKYMYNQESTAARLIELAAVAGQDKSLLFVEAGRDFSLGASVFLDPVSMAATLSAELLVVLSGDEDTVIDDAALLKRHLAGEPITWAGVVVNAVRNLADFKDTYLPELSGMGIQVLGVIPEIPELKSLRVHTVAEVLFCRVLAGEEGMRSEVKNIFVGAMSADSALRNPLFKKEKKLIITSGDRTDMILASLEDENTSAVILANNVLPPANVTNLAQQKGKPLMLVSLDTFQTARQVFDMEPLLGHDDPEKLDRITEAVAKHVDVNRWAGPQANDP